MDAAQLLGPHGPLAHAIEGYEHRPEQQAMAALVEQALARDEVALVEAGTGTGKTLAYLVPALLSGKKVVVSTGTKTLQDQLIQRDLPLLEACLDLPVSAAAMKGLSNYLCLRRYHELMESAVQLDAPRRRDLPLLREFRLTSRTGERSELGLAEDAPLWSLVQSGSDTRIGQRCKHYEACFVTRMRRAAEEAQIVVVNHHLFFADLALRGPHGGGVIPDYDGVIFDEAHQLEDVATEFFGVRVSTTRVELLSRDASRGFARAGLGGQAEPMCRDLLTAAGVFFAALPVHRALEAGRRSFHPQAFAGSLREPIERLMSAVEALLGFAKLHVTAHEEVAQLVRRAARLRDDLALISEQEASRVTWTECRGKSTSLGASPVDVAPILRERIFERQGAVVLTSATLSTSGDFSFVKKRLGIGFEVEELTLPSPFDYAAQAALYLPPGLPQPRDPDFVAAAAREILALLDITGGGAFILCTSLAMMRNLHAACAPQLSAPALLQGMAPKVELINTFRARGDAVLFASASFWEGVDVPGDALRLVIIDKLPFEVPSDPLVQARCERLEAEGTSAFMRYLVPSAALSLKQGFGRLIRSAHDRGIVAVLDRRLTTKGYGRVFLRSLPDACRCNSLVEVRAFWESGKQRAAAAG